MSALSDRSIAFIACVNNDAMLNENLLRSESLVGSGLIQKRGYGSASSAYNEAIANTTADILVFVHQDVYMPRGWSERLFAVIADIEKTDPDWAVLGLTGKSLDGAAVGHVWSSGMQTVVGAPGYRPTPAACIDELLIVLRRGSGITFDSGFKGFHLYGTDIAMTANAAGKACYIIDLPVIHNSQPVKSFFGAFFESYLFMRRKWWDVLPLESSCTTISKTCLGHLKMATMHRLKRMRAAPRTVGDQNAIGLARRLGFEK